MAQWTRWGFCNASHNFLLVKLNSCKGSPYTSVFGSDRITILSNTSALSWSFSFTGSALPPLSSLYHHHHMLLNYLSNRIAGTQQYNSCSMADDHSELVIAHDAFNLTITIWSPFDSLRLLGWRTTAACSWLANNDSKGHCKVMPSQLQVGLDPPLKYGSTCSIYHNW